MAVRKGGGEADENLALQMLRPAARRRPASRRSHRADRAQGRIAAPAGTEVRCRSSRCGRVEIVVEHRLHRPAQMLEIADLAVVHEGPAAVDERMAIVAPCTAAGRGPHMGEKQRRADLPGDAFEVAVGPGGQDVAVAAGLRMVAVPGDAEAVAVGRRLGAGGAMGLLDQGMRRRGHQFFEIERLPAIGCPAAHDGILRLRGWPALMVR